jgi:site-specific recombinase XerD
MCDPDVATGRGGPMHSSETTAEESLRSNTLTSLATESASAAHCTWTRSPATGSRAAIVMSFHKHPVTRCRIATMQQRLTAVRLLYAYLIDERIRSAEQNPVGRGRFTPGRAFAGKRDRGLLRHYERLPWIPGDDEWQAILLAASVEPVRNRLMLLLAYDGALRRSELVALTLRDLAFPHQQITVRPEVAKNGRGRVVMFGDVACQLLQR